MHEPAGHVIYGARLFIKVTEQNKKLEPELRLNLHHPENVTDHFLSACFRMKADFSCNLDNLEVF